MSFAGAPKARAMLMTWVLSEVCPVANQPPYLHPSQCVPLKCSNVVSTRGGLALPMVQGGHLVSSVR